MNLLGTVFTYVKKGHAAEVLDLIEKNTFFLFIFVKHIYFDSQQICQEFDAN